MKDYIMSILKASLLISVMNILIPDGEMKKYSKIALHILIALLIIMPLTAMKDLSFELPEKPLVESGQTAYLEGIKKEYIKRIESELEGYGRVYVLVDDELNVTRIEIYAKEVLEKEDEEKIIKRYAPKEIEIVYE